MKPTLIKICFLCFLLWLSSAACKKSGHQQERDIKWDLPVRLLGNRIPSSVIMGANSIAEVTFDGSNLIYKFDLNRIDGNYFWGRLLESQKNATSLKVYITGETEIIRVD